MSGTSWFDLASIQEQINKSIQEAAKIAEDASKYDILNFDEMAKREDEDEDEDEDDEDEEDLESDQNYDAKVSDLKAQTHYRSHESTKASSILYQGFCDEDDEDRTSNVFDQKQHILANKIEPIQLFNEGSGISELPPSSTAFDGSIEVSRDDAAARNKPHADFDFPLKSASLRPANGSGTEKLVISTGNSVGTSSSFIAPSVNHFTLNCSIDSESTLTTLRGAALTNNEADGDLRLVTDSDDKDYPATALNSEIANNDAADDFFGNQFNGINTIKKDKLRSISGFDYRNAPSMIEFDGPSSPSIADVSDGNDAATRHRKLDAAQKRDAVTIHADQIHIKKSKKKKIRKKKGSLDFFGMGGDDAAVDAAVTAAPPTVPSHRDAVPDPKVSEFSLFEPVGMLNYDALERVEERGKAAHTESEGDSYYSALSSMSRLPQRLPGITFIGMMGRTDDSNDKALFSFFDNVEEEIDSNEDPILKQVALNNSNPRRGERMLTDSYTRTLNVFGIFPSAMPSTSAVLMDSGDVESSGGARESSRHSASSVPEEEREGRDGMRMVRGGAVRVLHCVLETIIVFTKGLCGCLVTVCTEGCNGVGAPLGHQTDLTTRLRRGETVQVTLPSTGRDEGGTSAQVMVMLYGL